MKRHHVSQTGGSSSDSLPAVGSQSTKRSKVNTGGAANDAKPVPVDQWGADPVFWSYVKLFNAHIRELKSFSSCKESHVLRGRPIAKVEVVGHIVRITKKPTFGKIWRF
jgi:hypothetical protein